MLTLIEKGDIKCPIPEIDISFFNSDIKKQLKKIINCINKNQDLIIVPISTLEHANLVIIKPKIKEIYRYEPQTLNIKNEIALNKVKEYVEKISGKKMDMEEFKERAERGEKELDEAMDSIVEKIKKGIYKETNIDFKYIKPIEICPRMPVGLYKPEDYEGYQSIEEYVDKEDIEGGGYCFLWSIFFGILVISNPNMPLDKIMAKGYEIMGKDPKTFRYVIRGFYADILETLETIKTKYEKRIKDSYSSIIEFRKILDEIIEEKHSKLGGAKNMKKRNMLKKYGINLGYIGGCGCLN
jgi:hypothetical protein